jgi:hypothetical protein
MNWARDEEIAESKKAGRAIRVELEVPTTNKRGLPAHGKSMQHFQSDFAIHTAKHF